MRLLPLMLLAALTFGFSSFADEEASNEIMSPTETSEGQSCMSICLKEHHFYDCQESCVEVVKHQFDWLKIASR